MSYYDWRLKDYAATTFIKLLLYCDKLTLDLRQSHFNLSDDYLIMLWALTFEIQYTANSNANVTTLSTSITTIHSITFRFSVIMLIS